MNAVANLMNQFRQNNQAITDTRTDEERAAQVEVYANTIGMIQDEKNGSWKDKDNAMFKEEVEMLKKLYNEDEDEDVTFLEEIKKWYNEEEPGSGDIRMEKLIKASGLNY